jgi:hypothetical protein
MRSDPFGNNFWVDHCEIVGVGYIGTSVSYQAAVTSSLGTPVWYTDTSITNTAQSGLTSDVMLVRNVQGSNLGGDFVNAKRLIVNASVNHMRHNDGVHPDVVQVPIGVIDNMIVYGLEAKDVIAQAVSLGDTAQPMSDVAIVDALIENTPDDAEYQWISGGSTTNHVLYWHVTWTHHPLQFSTNNMRNLSMRNCVMRTKSATSGMNFPGAVFDNNHVIDGRELFGTNCTSGDPGWVNPAGGDYHPSASSVLANRLSNVIIPVDVEGTAWSTGGAIGGFQKR